MYLYFLKNHMCLKNIISNRTVDLKFININLKSNA